MLPAKVLEPHREPAHPAVGARCVRKGQRLAHLALVAQATRAVLPLPHTRVHGGIAQHGQDVLAPRFAIEGAPCNPLDPAPLILFLSLPLGHPLRPAEDGTRRPACRPEARGRGTRPKGLQDGGRIARVGLSENRGQMPGPQTAPGVLDEGMGLVGGPLAPDQPPHQFTVCGHRRVLPQVARPLCLVGLAALLLFFTTLPCSSHSRALGVRARTC